MRLARPSANPHGKDPSFYGFRSYVQLKLNLMPIRGFDRDISPEARLPFLLFTFISVPSHRSRPFKMRAEKGVKEVYQNNAPYQSHLTDKTSAMEQLSIAYSFPVLFVLINNRFLFFHRLRSISFHDLANFFLKIKV
jgi:hypothetical protein